MSGMQRVPRRFARLEAVGGIRLHPSLDFSYSLTLAG